MAIDFPLPPDVIEECVGLALQAPNASNEQTWHWIIVSDESKRAALGDLYRRSLASYLEEQAHVEHTDTSRRLVVSVGWLAEHLHEVPVHVICCVEGRSLLDGSNHAAASLYGSILPAVWNFQLALRSRALGSVWTTSHLGFEAEAAELLNIPSDVLQVALLPVAYLSGDDLRHAPRRPVAEVTSWDGWESEDKR